MAKKITAELFGIDTEDLSSISSSNIEEAIYEFGNVQYRIGRLETDGRDTQKEYNKLIKRKEELSKIIAEFFKN
jgi:hypothetical protein